MDSEVTFRTFLAVPLAPSFQTEVEPLLEKLKQDHPGVRWVKASEIHLTLHFFGPTRQKDLMNISKGVAPVTEKTRPFEIYLEGLGAFPHLNRPRIIWAGIRGEIRPLIDLQAKLEEGFGKAGFPCEARAFKPHLTLGRVQDQTPMTFSKLIPFGPTVSKKITSTHLFRSHLTPQGAHYEAIQTYPFAPS